MAESHAKPAAKAADSAMATRETMLCRTFGVGQEQTSNSSSVPVRMGKFQASGRRLSFVASATETLVLVRNKNN